MSNPEQVATFYQTQQHGSQTMQHNQSVEVQVNAWLAKNFNKIEITGRTQSGGQDDLVISIWYRRVK